jgi:hypothetical protein
MKIHSPLVLRASLALSALALGVLFPARAAAEGAGEEVDGGRDIHVEVRSDDPDVTLYRITGQSVGVGYVYTGRSGGAVVVGLTHFRSVCRAPCDVTTPAGEYFIGGAGVHESSKFHLESDRRLTVDAGKQGAWVAGLASAVVGGFAIIGGAVLLVPSIKDQVGGGAPGAITLTSGALLAGLGIALAAGNVTSVSVDRGAPVAPVAQK